MTKSRSPSLAEIAVLNLRKAGRSRLRAMTDAAKACTLIWSWAKCTRDLGHEPTRTEYSQFWKQAERVTYKELALYRDAFPTERDPQNLANYLNAQRPEASESQVLAVDAPGFVVAL